MNECFMEMFKQYLVANFHKKSELCSDPHHGEIQSQHHEMSDERLKTLLVVFQTLFLFVICEILG